MTVAFWGVTDGDSWLNGWPIRGRNGQPKPASDAVLKTAIRNVA